jgi:hypothetical protein
LDLSHLRIFGCAAYVVTPPTERKKLDPKATLHIFVGYSEESKSWLVWDPVSRVLKATMHCTFNEQYFPAHCANKPAASPVPVQRTPASSLSTAPPAASTIPPLHQAVEEAFKHLETMFDHQPTGLHASLTAAPASAPPKYPTPTTMRSLQGYPLEQEWR